jgi:hypothetical protein
MYQIYCYTVPNLPLTLSLSLAQHFVRLLDDQTFEVLDSYQLQEVRNFLALLLRKYKYGRSSCGAARKLVLCGVYELWRCRRMLTYADACIRMLTNAYVC